MDGQSFSNVCVSDMYDMAVHTAVLLYRAGEQLSRVDIPSMAPHATVIGSIWNLLKLKERRGGKINEQGRM